MSKTTYSHTPAMLAEISDKQTGQRLRIGVAVYGLTEAIRALGFKVWRGSEPTTGGLSEVVESQLDELILPLASEVFEKGAKCERCEGPLGEGAICQIGLGEPLKFDFRCGACVGVTERRVN